MKIMLKIIGTRFLDTRILIFAMGRGDLTKAMKAAEKQKLTKMGHLLPFKVFSEIRCLLNVLKNEGASLESDARREIIPELCM